MLQAETALARQGAHTVPNGLGAVQEARDKVQTGTAGACKVPGPFCQHMNTISA